MTPSTKADFDLILNTFGGTDGGVNFVQLQAMIEDLDAHANVDDAAFRLLLVQRHYANMIRIANGMEIPK